MRQVTLVLLTNKESELCRACPNIASIDGRDACYMSDYRGCECIKKLKEQGKETINEDNDSSNYLCNYRNDIFNK